MASICALPNEVIVLIGKACHPRDHNCLTRTSRRFHDVLNPLLYKRNVQQGLASAAFWAARHGRVDTLELLRIAGAEWNDNTASRLDSVHRPVYPYDYEDGLQHDIFFTPLHIAAMFGQDSAVFWLLDHGARIESVAHNLCSCQPGTTDFEKDDDFDPRDSPFLTPLHIAVCNGRLATARLLLSRGAGARGNHPFVPHFSVRKDTGSVLHAAARNNDAATVCFLLENALVDVDTRDSEGYTALSLACCHHGELHALKALLLHGADPNAQADDRRTPFTNACWYGYFNACIALIEAAPETGIVYGRDLNDPVVNTPCHVAVRPVSDFFPYEPPEDLDAWERDREALLRQLLDNRSPAALPVDALNAQRETPLSLAVQFPSTVGVVQCLLDHGADVNHRDLEMCTPLLTVLEHEDLTLIGPIVGTLLRHGAQVDFGCINHGPGALDKALGFARSSGDYTIANYLLLHASAANYHFGSEPGYKDKCLSKIVAQSHVLGLYAECRLLMQHGAKLNLEKPELVTLLRKSVEVAAQDGSSTSSLCFYLDMFPNLVTANDAMEMALKLDPPSRRAVDKRSEVFKLLFARPDFRLDPQENETTTLLHLACSFNTPLHVVEHLLDLGSNPNLFDKRLASPLSRAIESGCVHITELLLKHGADPFIRPSPEQWDGHIARLRKRQKQMARAHWYIDIDEDYKSPFELAIRHGWTGPDCHKSHKGSGCDDSESAKTFMSVILEHHKPPPPPADPSTLSYIHRASKGALYSNIERLETLLCNGADPNSGAHCTNPPLMYIFNLYAISQPDRVLGVLRLLLKHGANVHQKDAKGKCFVDVVKEASLARAENPDELAEFRHEDDEGVDDDLQMENEKFAVQCLLLYVCRLTTDAVSGEESVRLLTEEEIDATGCSEDYARRLSIWEKLQEEKALRIAKQKATAKRKRQREHERETQRENRRRSDRLLIADMKKFQERSQKKSR